MRVQPEYVPWEPVSLKITWSTELGAVDELFETDRLADGFENKVLTDGVGMIKVSIP